MRFTLSLVDLFLGGIIYALPNLTRREMLFSVPVPADFRRSALARHAITLFHLSVGLATLASVASIFLAPPAWLAAVITAGPLGILCAGGVAFFWQRRAIRPFQVQPSRLREVELSSTPDRIPRFVWFAAGPFFILAGAAAFLQQHWASIPARFPVHFGANGAPNRWSERTTRGVYGPLAFAAELCVWLLVLALAGWFGSRRSHLRSAMLGVMITAEYMLGLLFAVISLSPLFDIPLWIPVLMPLLFVIAMIVIVARTNAEPGDSAEPTSNDCWIGGFLYYNPQDAALMVEKRTGLGYTVNFGNRWSWALLAGLLPVIGSVYFLL